MFRGGDHGFDHRRIGAGLTSLTRAVPFGRREVLAGALVSGLAASWPFSSNAKETPVTLKTIDVHHHYLPPFYLEHAKPWMLANASGADRILNWSPERAKEALHAGSVETAVLSISAPGFVFDDASIGAADLARRCNDYAAGLARDHGQSFRFLTALPMPDVAASLQEIARSYDQLGAVGVGLLTSYHGKYLGDPVFLPVLEELNRRRAIVHVHPTDAPCCRGLVPDIPNPVIEFLFDTVRTITSLLWSGSLSRFPDIRFIFSHGGGAMASVFPRIASLGAYVPKLVDRVPEGPEVALSRLYADTASITAPAPFAGARAWLGDDRLLFGTDFPWGSPEGSVAALDRLQLGKSLLGRIKRDNAIKLFGAW
jgi:predicted TIM-barrel fold metal-dependent hydrolase